MQSVSQDGRWRVELTKRVKHLIIETLHLELEVDEIDNDAALFGEGLGLDSVDALELAIAVESEFGVSVNDSGSRAFGSANKLAEFLLEQGLVEKESNQ